MAEKAVSMETRLLAAVMAELASVNVSKLCRELGVSRETFYKWRRRFSEEGPSGLAERSSRPLSCPGRTPAVIEDEIVRARKEAVDAGEDYGAEAIMFRLRRRGLAVPSASTVHRVLVDRGLVTAQPQKRPKSATKRFVWPDPNGAWQIDATSWVLVDGAAVWIMDTLDDHSRVVPALEACAGPTTEAAWDTFSVGTERFGLPANVINDNGNCFTGRFLGGGQVRFEKNLAAAGVNQICSSPAHPQTCGKLERFHQTLKKWLRARPLAASPVELQAQLDEFRHFYNHERPHRALSGRTPIEVWEASPPAQPGPPKQPLPTARIGKVDALGVVAVNGYVIGVGTEHAHQPVLIVTAADHVTIIGNGQQLRRLTIDPHRRYQPSGKPPGRRPQQTGPCN